jgi:hypothetical protein
MNGSRALRQGNRPGCRVAAGAADGNFSFARLGIREGGRGCRCLQRLCHAERTGLAGDIGATALARNCALVKRARRQRDSRRDGTLIHGGRILHPMGLGCARFMPRDLFLPELVRRIARRTSRPSRCVGQSFQISLRRKAWQLRATEGGANASPSVCVISPSRHAHEHGEAGWKVLRGRLREKVAEYGA